MYNDDPILYDEFIRQRSQSGRRKALRLPLHAPGQHRDEQRAESENDEDKTSRRGVRVLDMSDGYSVVE